MTIRYTFASGGTMMLYGWTDRDLARGRMACPEGTFEVIESANAGATPVVISMGTTTTPSGATCA